jgi:hypothetical protein
MDENENPADALGHEPIRDKNNLNTHFFSFR